MRFLPTTPGKLHVKMSLKCHQGAGAISCSPRMPLVCKGGKTRLNSWTGCSLSSSNYTVIKPGLSMIDSLLNMQSHLMSLYLKISKMQLKLEVYQTVTHFDV